MNLITKISSLGLLILFSCIVSLPAWAQNGSISGQVKNYKNEPIAFGTVALLKPDSSLATGTPTDINGAFELTNLIPNTYILRASYVGYQTYYKQLNLAESQILVLPPIRLRLASQTLAQVEITAKKEFFVQGTDRKIYNVEALEIAKGGTASEVLSTIPSVTVDDAGLVALRGNSNITVLIDSKPSSLTGAARAAFLEQLPASAIERIEIMSNPSARYDAEGGAGIINIVLKRSREAGFYNSIALGIGTRNKYNGSISSNYRTEKYNISADLNARIAQRFIYGNSSRLNTFADTSFLQLSNLSGERYNQNYTARLAADYYLGQNHTFSITSTIAPNINKIEDNLEYNNLANGQISEQRLRRQSDESGHNTNFEIGAGSLHKFKNPKTKLSTNTQYSSGQSFNDESHNQIYDYLAFPLQTQFLPYDQQMRRQVNFSTVVAQADLDLPISSSYNAETGAKYTLRKIDNKLEATFRPNDNQTWQPDSRISNQFAYEEQVSAAYLNLATISGSWKYQIGARVENTNIQGRLYQTGQNFSFNYTNLFPNFYITKVIGPSHEIQWNYSKRINRPSYEMLNPFAEYDDPLNLFVGNPQLLPEFNHSTELNYTKKYDKLLLAGSVFYRYADQAVRRFREVDSSGISKTTFRNLAYGQGYGAEISANIDLMPNWTLMSALTGTRNTIRDLQTGEFNNQNFSWNGRLMSNIKFANHFSSQMSGTYNGPNLSPQGIIGPRYALDISGRKDFMNNKVSLSLRVADVFNTSFFTYDLQGRGFVSQGRRKRETRIAFLTLTWRLGKPPRNDRRKSDERGGSEGEEG